MNDDVYKELAQALDRLPEGFPQTKSGIELEMLKKMFLPDEALVGSKLCHIPEPVDVIAERANLSVEKTEEVLNGMRVLERPHSGRVLRVVEDGIVKYRLRPFMVGFWAAQHKYFSDAELAHLVLHYYKEGGMEGLRSLQPVFTRALPTQKGLEQVPSEYVATYEDAKKIILNAKQVNVYPCNCRKHKDVAGVRECDFPIRTCMGFYTSQAPQGPEHVTKEEALKVLDECERLGLVHIVSNFKEGLGFLCNCCGCCCFELMAINDYNLKAVNRSNYYPAFNSEKCDGCGICEKRCQVHACKVIDGKVTVDMEKCLGCGLCVTGCPIDAVTLKARPEAERIEPYDTPQDWQEARLKSRGLLK